MATPKQSLKSPGSNRPPMLGVTKNRSFSVSAPRSMLSRSSTFSNLHELTKLLNSRPEEEDTQQSTLEILRLRVKYFMTATLSGLMFSYLLLFLSVVSCFFYILQTYYEYEDQLSGKDRAATQTMNYAELVLAGMFSIEWVLDLFISEHKSDFLFRCRVFILDCL